MQICRRHLLNHFAACRHLAKVGGTLRRPGSLPSGDHRPGEQRLRVVNLALDECVPGDERNRGHIPAWKERRKLADQAGPKPLRGQVVLVKARIAGQCDGGQKLLQRLIALAMQHIFNALSLLQAKVILQTAAYCIVKRELQRLASRWLRRHAAEEGIGGGGWVRPLRRTKSRNTRQNQSYTIAPQRPPARRNLSKRIHYHLSSQMIANALRMQLTCTVFSAIWPDESRLRFLRLKPSEP